MSTSSLAPLGRALVAIALALSLATAAPGSVRAAAKPAPALPAPSPVPTLSDEQAPHIEKLANGLRVAIVENHAVPVVETAMWYDFGALDEVAGKTGLAHALAHMMYRGTPSLSGSGLDDVFTQLGAQETATTANDFTAFHFVLPADKLELALRVEADRMQHLYINDSTWQSERARVLAEHDADLMSPLAKLYDSACRAASATPLCSLSSLGSRADIASATSQDLRTYYQSYYAPNDATLVIVGDIDTQPAMRLVHAAFGDIPASDPPERANVPPFYNHDKQVDIAGDFPNEVVDLVFRAPGTGDADAPAFSLLDSVINNPRSKFYRGLVGSGYTLGYSTQVDQNVHGGLLHVFLVVAPTHSSAQARDAFIDILTTAEHDGFAPDLVNAAKTAASLQSLYARDSIAGLANRVGYAVAVDNLASPAVDDDRIAAASDGDVDIAARKYLDGPIVTALLTPSGHAGGRSGPPKATVSDNFSNRAPLGPIVEARWVQDALATTSLARTRATPTDFKLANGLHVLVVPIHSNATVFVQGNVDTSPRFDPVGKEGVGAMVSSLLAFGGAKYDFSSLRSTIDQLGASVDLGLSFDAHGRAADLDTILDILADDLRSPTFAKNDIDHVRAETLAAISARDSDADYQTNHLFDTLMFSPSDPTLREPVYSSIAAITANDLHRYAKNYVRPDATTITIVGDFDPATIESRVRTAFGRWQAVGPKPDIRPDPIPQTRAAKRYLTVTGTSLLRAHLGERAVSHTDPNFFAVDLINVILGAEDAYDTRIRSELTVKRNLAYNAGSSFSADRYRGTLDFRFVTKPELAGEAAARLRYELQRMQRDPVGPFELMRAKSKVVARARVAEESTETIAERVENIGVDGLPLDFEATLPQKYGSIDGATILRIANQYLHPNALIEVDEGPRQ
jgi:zinc protease